MSGGVAVDFSALSKAGASLAEGLEKQRTSTLLQALGGQVQSGDYAGAAKTAFDAGDLQTGLSLVKLGESKAQAADFQKGFGGGLASLYGGQPDAVTGTPATVRAPSFTDSSGPAGSYLATLRGKESGGNALAKNPNSTATGIDQFTSQTWDGLRRKYPELGLTADGRTDPAQSTRAMEKFTADNARALTSAGVPITPGNLYVSHFLGEAGGPRFIRGVMQNPDAPATAYVTPGAAAANRTIFFNRDGSPKSAGAVYAERTSRFGSAAPAARTQVASADPSFMPTLPNATTSTAPSAPKPAMEIGGSGTMTLPAEADPVQPEQRVQIAQAAPQVLQQSGMKPSAVAQVQGMPPGSAQRIQFFVRALSHPGAPEGGREAAKALLANELQLDRENRQTTADQKEYAFRVLNGYRGSVEDYFSDKRKGADSAVIQEYEYAKKNNGYEGSLLDYTKSKAEAGSTKVINNLGAENKQDEAVQKDFGEIQIEQRKAAGTAASSLANIRAAKQIMQDPNFYSGTFGSLATEGKKALASIGLAAPDSARANEGFTKLSAQQILDKAGGSFGGAFSNGDRDAIKQTAANIDNTPAGNALILDMAERVALRAQENHRMMIAYKARPENKGRIDDRFLSQIDQYARDNPIFGGLDIPGPSVRAPTSQQPQGAPRPGQRDANTPGPLKPLSEAQVARGREILRQPGANYQDLAAHLRSQGFDPAALGGR